MHVVDRWHWVDFHSIETQETSESHRAWQSNSDRPDLMIAISFLELHPFLPRFL